MHPAMHPAGSLAPGRSCLAPPAGASHHQEPPVERVATPWNPSGGSGSTPVWGERPSLAAHAPTPCGHVAGGPFSPCKATLTPTWLTLWPDTSPPPGCSNSNDSAAGYVGSVFRHGTASTRHAGRRHGHQQLGEQKRMGRTAVSLHGHPRRGHSYAASSPGSCPALLGESPHPSPVRSPTQQHRSSLAGTPDAAANCAGRSAPGGKEAQEGAGCLHAGQAAAMARRREDGSLEQSPHPTATTTRATYSPATTRDGGRLCTRRLGRQGMCGPVVGRPVCRNGCHS